MVASGRGIVDGEIIAELRLSSVLVEEGGVFGIRLGCPSVESPGENKLSSICEVSAG